MPLVSLQLPPGFFKNGTRYAAKNRWHDGQLVRFRDGFPHPIGGWKAIPLTVAGSPVTDLQGSTRCMYAWRANDQQRWISAGSTRKLYAFDGGTFTDITPSGFVVGTDDVAVGFGYGAYQYGKGNYGTPRTASAITSEPGRWTLDSFGQDLYAMANSDGRLCSWPRTGIAAAVTNAPTNNRSFIVTNERAVMILGAGDGPLAGGAGTYTPNPRHVWWCSQEAPTDWDRTSTTNTAGDFNLDTPGQIMTACRFSGDIFIFTDQDLHRCTYVGLPFIYGFHKLASGCGVAGPGAVAESSTLLAWMGTNGFFVFDGYVKPLECEVLDFLLRDMNKLQLAKVHAGHNAAFNEFTWWYASANSLENDSYVTWNYAENHWTTGRMARTAWTDANVWPFPMAAYSYRDVSNVSLTRMYQHEQGYLDDHVARAVWVESGPIEIGQGDQRAVVDRIFHDVNPTTGAPLTPGADSVVPEFTFTFNTRDAPNLADVAKGPYTIDNTRGYTDVRFNARQFTMRVDQVVDVHWTVGIVRLNIKQGSMR